MDKRAKIRGMIGEMGISYEEAADIAGISTSTLSSMTTPKGVNEAYDKIKAEYDNRVK